MALICGDMPTEHLLHSQLVKRSKARAATQAIGLGKLITCSLLHTARQTSSNGAMGSCCRAYLMLQKVWRIDQNMIDHKHNSGILKNNISMQVYSVV